MAQSPATVAPIAAQNGKSLPSLTLLLQQAKAGTVVRLSPGTYSSPSVQFPIVVPAGVILLGDEKSQGQGTVLQGGGDWLSPSLGAHNVTVILQEGAELRGVTVTNPNPNGSGVWLESVRAIVARCTLRDCDREGLVATGSSLPLILDNIVQGNRLSGISLLRNSKGEIWGNTCRQMQMGIALGGDAAPLIARNNLTANAIGMVIAGNARPVLRVNRIEANQTDGISIQGNAQPDLGQPQDPAANSLRSNGRTDLSTSATTRLMVVGNLLNPARAQGSIEFRSSEISQAIDWTAPQLPPLPLAAPTPAPTPTPVPAPAPAKPVTPTPVPAPSPSPSKPVPPQPTPPPKDLTNHWAEAFIKPLNDLKILSGFPDATFRPDASISRVEFAALIVKAFDRPLLRPEPRFEDVAPSFWGYGAIVKACRMGFLTGFPDNSFRANQQLTRTQAILALVTGLALTGGNSGLLAIYGDRAQIPSYATNGIATATQHHLIVNYPQLNQVEPLRPISRAEVAVMVYQALVLQGRVPVIASPYIPKPLVDQNLTDITGHWAEPFIRALIAQSLLSAYPDGSFQPDAVISRAELATLIVKTFNPTPRNPEPKFQDLPIDFWARSAIIQAVQGGFFAGSSSSNFQPSRSIQRCDVWVSFTNGLQLKGGNLNLLDRFSDRLSIPKYAQAAIATALEARLAINYPDVQQLTPKREATRAEVAAICYQSLVKLGRMPALPCAYIAMPL
jgi:parallel beta-helix repeat protein